MRGLILPDFVHYVGAPTIEAHSRGFTGEAGHSAFSVGGGARWRWDMEVTAMSLQDARAMRAWLHSLRGPYGTFLARFPVTPVYVASASGYSDGALHSDDSDYSDGAAGPAYETLPLTVGALAGTAPAGSETLASAGFTWQVGAYVSVETDRGNQVVQVVSVSSFFGTATIRPRLRGAAARGARVQQGSVWGLFRLRGDPPAIPFRVGRSHPFKLEIEEAV